MVDRSPGADLWNQLDTLSQLGVVGDASDGQLLQHFLNGSESEPKAQAAFAVLVDRHGPMVLRVCRQWLGDSHGAEDACQATFLVLVRKAGSVRQGDSLASWLHGVAVKVAARARTEANRRRALEQRGGAIRGAGVERDEGNPTDSWPELHEEIARLPERYRLPVVLCYLEGLSTEAAAVRLGCPRGTILSRLSRARERLRYQLSRRGLAPVSLFAWMNKPEAPAPVPDSLVAAIKALAAAGAVGTVPVSVLTLSTGVIHAMTFAKIKMAFVVISAAVVIGMGGAGVHAFQQQGGDGAAKVEPVPVQDAPKAEEAKPPTTATDPTQRPFSVPMTGRAAVEPAPAVESVTAPELAAQLKLARKKFARLRSLHETGATPQAVFDEAEGEVQILEGRIAGRAEQLEEDLELLKVRLEAKRAEADVVQAEVEYTKAILAMQNRINTKMVGRTVSAEELAKSEAELKGKTASLAVRGTEVREVEVRIKQVERRLLGLAPLLKTEAKPNANDPRLVELRLQEEKATRRLEDVRRR